MLQSTLSVAGHVTIQVLEAGQVVQTVESHNLVVDTGAALLLDLLVGTVGVAAVNYLAVGTDGTTPVAGDTALIAEQARVQVMAFTRSGRTLTVQVYLPSTVVTDTVDLQEAGLLNAATGGSLFARVVHTAITKTSNNALLYSWNITIS